MKRLWIGTSFCVALIALLTLVVWREQKNGGACYEQRNSHNSEPIPPIVVEEHEPQQQAYNSTSDSENYLCRLITPANLPTDYLALFGIGGILVALLTLDSIRRQASAAEIAAEATRDSVLLQQTLKNQWVDLGKWSIARGGSNPIPLEDDSIHVRLSFEISNATEMPLRLKHIEIFREEGTQINSPNITLNPSKSYLTSFEFDLNKRESFMYDQNSLQLPVFGNISFIDNFKKRQNQVLGQVFTGGTDGFTVRDFDRWLGPEEDDDENPN